MSTSPFFLPEIRGRPESRFAVSEDILPLVADAKGRIKQLVLACGKLVMVENGVIEILLGERDAFPLAYLEDSHPANSAKAGLWFAGVHAAKDNRT